MKRTRRVALTTITVLAAVVGVWQYVEAKARPDYTGEWELVLHVEQTTYSKYQDKDFQFVASLTQAGEVIDGSGELRKEGNETVPHARRSRTVYRGKTDGRTATLRFDMRGHLRDTSGLIVLEPGPEKGMLRGTFTWSAAESKGTATARLVKPPRP